MTINLFNAIKGVSAVIGEKRRIGKKSIVKKRIVVKKRFVAKHLLETFEKIKKGEEREIIVVSGINYYTLNGWPYNRYS